MDLNKLGYSISLDKINADMVTECKKHQTAVNRFFKSLGKQNIISDIERVELIEEEINNSLLNGYNNFQWNKDYDGKAYSWGVEELEKGLFYIYLNIVL